MKLLTMLLPLRGKTRSLLEEQEGKTLAEYQSELLSKMGKRQFEKLKNLGLSLPVQLG